MNTNKQAEKDSFDVAPKNIFEWFQMKNMFDVQW